MLDTHPNISCGPETGFLADLHRVYKRFDRLKGFGYDRAYYEDRLSRLFADYHEEYMRKRGKRRWADKTPTYVFLLGFIKTLFPDAQIVHVIRDPRDVVASHRDRWGYQSGAKSAYKWRRSVTAAREFAESAGDGEYTEVRYEDLVSDAEKVMRGLLEFLNEPWDPIVLDYTKVEHDTSGTHAKFTEKRREEGKESSVVYSSRVGAGKKSLDPLLQGVCMAVNRELMKELGYE